jgi:hypothetical protein
VASARRAALLVLIALAGCGETEGIVGGGSVIGETLTIYSLLPEPDRPVVRDIVDGQRLALLEARGRAGAFKVNFASLDSTGGGTTGSGLPGQVASATRQAIADAQIIAVIGDLTTDTAVVSVPLLNSAGILHVSPGPADPRFITGEGGAQGEPQRFYPAGQRTFFPGAPRTEGNRPGAAFRRSFAAAFGRRPRAEAVDGYRAMRAVLEAIRLAGERANRRQAVIDAFRLARGRDAGGG